MRKRDEVAFVTCPECGTQQGDMGRHVTCDECGAPMPSHSYPRGDPRNPGPRQYKADGTCVVDQQGAVLYDLLDSEQEAQNIAAVCNEREEDGVSVDWDDICDEVKRRLKAAKPRKKGKRQ